MKPIARSWAASLALVFMLVGSWATAAQAADIPRVSIDELKSMIEDDSVVVLDVRSGRDWSSSEFKIQGAKHTDPSKISAWAGDLPKDKKLVLYCA